MPDVDQRFTCLCGCGSLVTVDEADQHAEAVCARLDAWHAIVSSLGPGGIMHVSNEDLDDAAAEMTAYGYELGEREEDDIDLSPRFVFRLSPAEALRAVQRDAAPRSVHLARARMNARTSSCRPRQVRSRSRGVSARTPAVTRGDPSRPRPDLGTPEGGVNAALLDRLAGEVGRLHRAEPESSHCFAAGRKGCPVAPIDGMLCRRAAQIVRLRALDDDVTVERATQLVHEHSHLLQARLRGAV
jgi:hypothetical protein